MRLSFPWGLASLSAFLLTLRLSAPALAEPLDAPIRVGGDRAYPPYEYINDQGEPEGFSVDMTRAVARQAGLDVEFHLGLWTDVVARLERGEIDILQAMFFSPRRAERFLFSPPYFHNYYVTVVRKEEGPPPVEIDELARRLLTVQAGDWINDWLADRLPHVPLYRVASQEEVLAAVSDGRADCGLVIHSGAIRAWAKSRYPNLWIGRQPVATADLCFAFRKDRPDLLARFTEGLRLVEESGERHRIGKRWFGLTVPSRWEILAPYAVGSAGLFALVVLAFLLWNWSLRRALARRQRLLRESLAQLRKELDHRIARERQITHLNHLLKTIRNVNQLIVRETDPNSLLDQSAALLVEFHGYRSILLLWTDADGVRIRKAAVAGTISNAESFAERLAQGILPPCVGLIPPPPAVARITNPSTLCPSCPTICAPPECVLLATRLVCQDTLYGFLIASCHLEKETEEEEIELFRELAGDLAFALHAHEEERRRREAEEEARHLTEAIAQAEKLTAIGRLAAGVAHDFNNLLMGILGYVQFCRDELPPDHPVLAHLDEIAKAGKRTGDLVRQLLAFARKQVVSPRVLSLNDELTVLQKMLRRFLREDIELVWHLAPDLPPLYMDPYQINQIVFNLCSNAQKAIAGGGTITIETRLITFTAEEAARHPEILPGRWIRLSIADTGCGMSPSTMAHLFEPFFTTHPTGEGTGLGLCSVHGIVTQNGGFITVESELGKGSTFHIHLPPAPPDAIRVDNGPTPQPSEPLPPSLPSQTVLIVEDNASILTMLARFLQRSGYQVLTASSPREALSLPAERLRPVALILTDVVLPEMSGRDLVEKLRPLCPSAAVLFMSGYTTNAIVHDGILDKGVPFIAKPVDLTTLAAKIQEVLRAHSIKPKRTSD